MKGENINLPEESFYEEECQFPYMCFNNNNHTCKHSSVTTSLTPTSSEKQVVWDNTTIFSNFPVILGNCHHPHYQQHNHLPSSPSEETRSSREYNNNKLHSMAPITPEDLDTAAEEKGYSWYTVTTSSRTSYILSSTVDGGGGDGIGGRPAAGRFSTRRLNIFHMSPLLLLLVCCVSLAGKNNEQHSLSLCRLLYSISYSTC